MDNESWIQGYLVGVSLHNHLRITQHSPSVIASMSVTGIAADFDWFADLSGVETLTRLTAEYTGDVTVAYSYNGTEYTEFVPMEELLSINPALLLHGADPDVPRLWFHFHLADNDTDLTTFTLWGFPKGRTEHAV